MNQKQKIFILLGIAIIGSIVLFSDMFFKKPSILTPISETEYAVSNTTPCVQDSNKKITSLQREYLLTDEEVKCYLKILKLVSIPKIAQQKKLYLFLDWGDINEKFQHSGRKIILGFKEPNQNPIQIEYSEYNFSYPSEYSTYASREDYQAITTGTSLPQSTPLVYGGMNTGPKVISSISGVRAFTTFIRGGIVGLVDDNEPYGTIEKIIVFPFKNYYIAFTTKLTDTEYSKNDFEALLESLYSKRYPPEDQTRFNFFDTFIDQLQFSEMQ